MKKRILCFALVMLMVLGMVPVSAFAAVERTTSNAGIEAIKGFEGFEANEYTAGGKTYIGYGTPVTAGTYPSGITQTEAVELLKEELKNIDKAINGFAANNGLILSQHQHDALASLSFNIGIAWLNGSGPLRRAVLNGADAAEMVRVFARNTGVATDSIYFAGLMARRMKEANIYINGVYSAPANYSYVILDAAGGTCDYEVYGYITTQSPALNLVATKGSDSFMGWYDSNGNPVSVLDKNTAGKTLTARYNSGSANYEITGSQAANGSLYHTPSVGASVKGTLGSGTVYVVSQEKMVTEDGKTYKWAYVTQKNNSAVTGWICLGEVASEGSSTDTVLAIGTVNATTLRVYESANVNSNELTPALTKDATVRILAYKNVTTLTGTQSWGKINHNGQYGWINLANVKLQTTSSEDNTTLVGATGTIVNAEEVNVRVAAGIGSALKTTIKKDTKVTILQTTKVDGNMWAEIKWNGINTGWVYMHYISTSAISTGTGTTGSTNGPVLYTGTVNSTINLNVRKSPAVSGALVTSLPTGTKINIYETTTTNGVKWGYCDKGGWVCLQYVTLNATGNAGSTGTETPGTSTSTNATVVNCSTAVNIRASASVGSALVGTAPVGSGINIYEVTTVNGVKWGRCDKGWVCMQYVQLNSALPEGSVAPEGVPTHVNGTVNSATLTIYKSPTNNSAEVGTMKKGQTTVILEQQEESTTLGTTKKWGKVTVNGVTGWINLAYVSLELGYDDLPDTGNTGSTAVTGTGVIANCAQVNIRSAAGVGNPLVTTLQAGTKVNIVEKTTVNNAPWAKITWNNGAASGWACMYYITVDAITGDSGTTTIPGTSTTVISATGIVNSNIDLNVRSGPGLGYAKVGSLAKGTKVSIYEQATADGMIWGKTSTGWVSMSYITIENTSSSGNGVMGTIARCHNAVNVRSAPGTGNALVGTIRVGTRVEIYEQTMYSGQYWGRVAQGWICMQYVLLDAELPPTTGGTTTDPSTGATTPGTTPGTTTNGEVAFAITGGASNDINVYKTTAVSADIAGKISGSFNILAIMKVDGKMWGRVDHQDIPGWILLSDCGLSLTRYTQRDNESVYDAAGSTNKIGEIPAINTAVGNMIMDVDLVGTKVWLKVNTGSNIGWLADEVLSNKTVVVSTAVTSTDATGSEKYTGKCFNELTAYESYSSEKTVFTIAANTTLNIQEVVCNVGAIWGKVTTTVSGVTTTGWIRMESVTLNTATKTVVADTDVYNADETVLDTLLSGSTISVSMLKLNTTGVLMGQIQSGAVDNTVNGTSVQGGWIAINALS